MRYIGEYKNLILRLGISFYFIYYSIKLLFINKTSTIAEMIKLQSEAFIIILGIISLIIGLMILIGWFTKYLSYVGIIFILLIILSGLITNNLIWKEIPILAATIYLAEVGCTQYGLDEVL